MPHGPNEPVIEVGLKSVSLTPDLSDTINDFVWSPSKCMIATLHFYDLIYLHRTGPFYSCTPVRVIVIFARVTITSYLIIWSCVHILIGWILRIQN